MKPLNFIDMKKLLYFIFAALVFVSCEGPMGPPGPSGDTGEPDAYMDYIDISINRWYPSSSGEGYYANYTVNALTEYIYQYGVIVAYIETGNYKTPLPYTRYYKIGDYEWSELIDFTFAPGVVTFYVTPSDFYIDPDQLPEPIKVRLVMVW